MPNSAATDSVGPVGSHWRAPKSFLKVSIRLIMKMYTSRMYTDVIILVYVDHTILSRADFKAPPPCGQQINGRRFITLGFCLSHALTAAYQCKLSRYDSSA